MNKLNTALLIDDDPINNFLSYAVLVRAKIVKDIQIEGNGENALIFLQKYYADNRSLPELIFLDLDMPIMNGLEFLKSFNKEFHLLKEKTTIIILTNFGNEREKVEAAKFGVSNFVLKPLTGEVLNNLLANVIKKSTANNC
ncbi:MAG: response regulator [Cytophagaceae bacterium]|nr:response regulator [Cytophagaceae bacterium]